MPGTLKIANSVRANETVRVVNYAKGPKERNTDDTWKRRAEEKKGGMKGRGTKKESSSAADTAFRYVYAIPAARFQRLFKDFQRPERSLRYIGNRKTFRHLPDFSMIKIAFSETCGEVKKVQVLTNTLVLVRFSRCISFAARCCKTKRFGRSRRQRVRRRGRMKSVRRSVEGPTLTAALLIPVPARCAHKICLRSPEKRSYRAESVEGITATRRERSRERGGE